MKRQHYLVFAIVSGLGLLCSLALIPGPSQLALLYYKGWRYEAATRIYEARLKGGDLSQNTVVPLAQMYHQQGETDRAIALLERLAHNRPDVAAMIAEFYKSAQRPNDYLRTLERINRMAGSEETLRELCNRYRDAGRYADLIASLKILIAKYSGTAADFQELANLEAANGRLHEAIGTLTRFENDLPDAQTSEVVQTLTSLWLDAGDGDKAFAIASGWLTTHPDPEVGTRLADMLASKGQPELAARLPGPRQRRAPPMLEAVLRVPVPPRPIQTPVRQAVVRPPVERRPEAIAPRDEESIRASLEEAAAQNPARQPELVAYWTNKLSAGGAGDERRIEAVQALVALDAYDAALPSVADLARRKGGDYFYLYLDAAAKTNRRDEVVQFLAAELRRTDLNAKAREDRLYALIERGGEAAALPWIREFAERTPGTWGSAYEEALEKLGKRADLIDYWQSQAARADTPAGRKREIAYGMLEAGAKAASEKVFLALARNSAPESADVQELRFLWGPRPKAVELDWIEARAIASHGAERAKWMEYLTDAGAPSRAVRVANEDVAVKDAAVKDAWFAAIERAGDKQQLAAAVMREVQSESRPEKLEKLAALAAGAEQTQAEQLAYEKLLSVRPDSSGALRFLGMLMYGKSSYGPARDYLGRYFKLSAGDPESNIAFAEILSRAEDRMGARQYFTRALEQVEKLPASMASRTQRAMLLNRLGRKKDALAEYKLLLAERPADDGLRAEYAELLVEQGSYREAQKIASSR